MSDKAKLSWSKPQLIVLGKGAPEEAVLMACKTNGATQNAGAMIPNHCSNACLLQGAS